MGSMHTGLEETSNGFNRLAAYFVERTKGQVGLIITGGIAPNRAGMGGTNVGQTYQSKRNEAT